METLDLDKIQTHTATANDLFVLYTCYSAFNAKEVYTLSDGKTLPYCISQCFSDSEVSQAIYYKGTLLGIYGIIAEDNYVGYIWFVPTIHYYKYRTIFLDEFQHAVKKMRTDFSILYGYVMVDNKASQRWMKNLGFTIEKEIIKIYDENFYKFKIEYDTKYNQQNS